MLRDLLVIAVSGLAALGGHQEDRSQDLGDCLCSPSLHELPALEQEHLLLELGRELGRGRWPQAGPWWVEVRAPEEVSESTREAAREVKLQIHSCSQQTFLGAFRG